MELPRDIYAEIKALSEAGNELFDQREYDSAIEQWQQALDRVPAPRADLDATLWLCASIGDAHYQAGRHAQAAAYLLDAANAPGGTSNPFVLYRLGQCHARLGDIGRATDFLLRAYMLDGTDIFDADPEGADFLKILESRGLIPDSM